MKLCIHSPTRLLCGKGERDETGMENYPLAVILAINGLLGLFHFGASPRKAEISFIALGFIETCRSEPLPVLFL